MGRKCEYFWCSNRYGDSIGKSFHSFPKDEELCRMWVTRCYSSEASELFASQGKSGFLNRKVCSDHFSLESFRNPKRKDIGLLPGAVPLELEQNHYYPDNTLQASFTHSQELHKQQPEALLFTLAHDPQDPPDAITNRSRTKDEGRFESPQLSEFEKNMGAIEFLEDNDFFTWLSLAEKEQSELMTAAKDDSWCTASPYPIEHSLLADATFQTCILNDDLNFDYCSIDDNIGDSEVTYLSALKDTSGVNAIEETLQEVTFFDAKNSLSSIKAQLNVERKKRQNLQEYVIVLKRQLFVSKQTSDRRLQSLKKQKLHVSKLRQEIKELRKSKSENEMLGDQAKGNPVILDTLRNAKRKPKGRRYHPMTMKFACSTYLSGPRTYRFIKNAKYLALPHKNSVYLYNKGIRIEPGLNKPILTRVKEKVKRFKLQHEKIVTISVDGMAVKSELSYSAKADVFHGFPDDGVRRKFENNDTTKLATEAVTVMASGLYRHFKQPLGYVLAHNTLGSQPQLRWIKKSIRAARRCGLIPMVLTMDQCATNEKMAREAGATPKAPFIDVDDVRLAVMYDTPHLTKNARNALFKHNAVFNGMIASYEHIRELHDIDKPPGLTLVPKLKEKSINLPPFAAMNVALATRTLSESCAVGMRHYVQTDELPKAALQTAEFIHMHDKLFDTFNSKDKYSDSVGKAKEESTTLKIRQKQPHYLKGFIGNIYAVMWLWKQVKRNFACSYLCTNPLCQDCLENFFAEIRRRCGFNDAPNTFQFGSAFKYAMIAATEDNFDEGKNCQTDHTEPLLNDQDLENLPETNPAQTQEEFSYKFEELDVSSPFTALTKETNALVYIAGAAVRKLPHLKCRDKLTIQHEDNIPDNEDYQFCKLKSSISTRTVTIPNSTLYNIALLSFVAFKQKFRKFLHENRRLVKKRMKMYVKYDQFDYATCKLCFDKLVDVLFNTLIQGFLREVRVQNKIAVNKKRGLKRNRKAKRMNLPEK